MLRLFALPPLLPQLKKELEMIERERIHATAQLAYWKMVEDYKLKEAKRVEREIASAVET